MRLAVDLHTHTVASTGGELTEPELLAAAGAAGLDVLGITEHHSGGPATAAHAGTARSETHGALIVVRGREFTAGPGHRVIVDGGPVIMAHPFAPYPNGSAVGPPSPGELLEVWNGPWRSDRPWQADNEAALAWWVELLSTTGPHDPLPIVIGNSDTHLADQIGTPCTVVEVDSRSSAAALDAVARGHSWVVIGSHVEVDLTVHCTGAAAGPGQILTGRGPVAAAVSVAGAGCCRVVLLDRNAVVEVGQLVHDGTLVWSVAAAGLLRVEIRDEVGDMLALSNPVRILGNEHGDASARRTELVAGRSTGVPTGS